jgi:HAD superfamily hydrolase (TIGR01509 family)
MKQLEALIFDVDGTLADTERDGHRVAFNKAFAEAGLDWNWDIALYGQLLAVTGGKERMRFFLEKHDPQLLEEAGIEEKIAELHRRKTHFYLELLREGEIPLRPGVERLLDEARDAGLRLAIATTTTPENVTTLLSATLGDESIEWFEVIAAGDIVPAKKPAPDIYDYALEKMGLSAAQCLALEDSRNGLLSATDAGIPTIITVNGYTQAEDFQGALLVLDQFGQPSQPAQVLAGDMENFEHLSVDALKALSGDAEVLGA